MEDRRAGELEQIYRCPFLISSRFAERPLAVWTKTRPMLSEGACARTRAFFVRKLALRGGAFSFDSFDVKIGLVSMLAAGGGSRDSTFWQPHLRMPSSLGIAGFFFEGGDNLRLSV